MGLPLSSGWPPATTLNSLPPQTGLPTAYTPQPWLQDHCPRAYQRPPVPPHTPLSTFLQCFSLPWGEDSPIPVTGPWTGTLGVLRATVETGRNWSQVSCKGGQGLAVVSLVRWGF